MHTEVMVHPGSAYGHLQTFRRIEPCVCKCIKPSYILVPFSHRCNNTDSRRVVIPLHGYTEVINSNWRAGKDQMNLFHHEVLTSV